VGPAGASSVFCVFAAIAVGSPAAFEALPIRESVQNQKSPIKHKIPTSGIPVRK
jgi:hypothetical protein